MYLGFLFDHLGLGLNRGFHTAFDAVWSIQKHFSAGRCGNVPQMIAAREELFALMKSLSAFTKLNILQDNYKGYTIDPATRYKQWRPSKA